MSKCEFTTKSIIEKKERIIVIGDLHADFKKTIELFVKLKLIEISKSNNKMITIGLLAIRHCCSSIGRSNRWRWKRFRRIIW